VSNFVILKSASVSLSIACRRIGTGNTDSDLFDLRPLWAT